MSKTALDDINKIREFDQSDMLSFCIDAAKHYGNAAEVARTLSLDCPRPHKIIAAGMGGSAIGGELLKDWARDQISIPIEVCREYSLPAYADKDTLVFIISYSGETEESLSAFLDAIRRKCTILCVSSGGKLQELSEKLSIPHLHVPSGMAPRATLPYLFLPLPLVLQKIGLVSNVNAEVSETVKVLESISEENSPYVPLKNNFSKMLASTIYGTVPVIYGSGFYHAAAQRFKTQFNENSKVPAKWEFFPELNHNEIVGWETLGKLAKCFTIILIRDSDEPIEMRYRINITKELMHDQFLEIVEVSSKGKGKMAKMCSVICIGDFASVYLAILRGVDPTPVRTISSLKDKLAEGGTKAKIIRELQRITVK